MVNYYRRFVPRLARALSPLHAAIAAAGKSKEIQWSEQCGAAFKEAKAALAGATLLNHPSPFASTVLSVDASDVTVGADLSQFN